MLKSPGKSSLETGKNYLVDKIKLVMNKHNSLVLQSTSLTVLRDEAEVSSQVDSIEFNQKQDEEMINFADGISDKEDPNVKA